MAEMGRPLGGEGGLHNGQTGVESHLIQNFQFTKCIALRNGHGQIRGESQLVLKF